MRRVGAGEALAAHEVEELQAALPHRAALQHRQGEDGHAVGAGAGVVHARAAREARLDGRREAHHVGRGPQRHLQRALRRGEGCGQEGGHTRERGGGGGGLLKSVEDGGMRGERVAAEDGCKSNSNYKAMHSKG